MKLLISILLVTGLGFGAYTLYGSNQELILSTPIDQVVSAKSFKQHPSLMHSELRVHGDDFNDVIKDHNTPFLAQQVNGTTYNLNIGPATVGPVAEEAIYFTYTVDSSKADPDNKAFRGMTPARIKVFSKLSLSLQKDWCPVSATETTFKWSGLDRMVKDRKQRRQAKKSIEVALADHSDMLGKAIATSYDCSQITRHLQTLWKPRVISVSQQENTDITELKVHIKPTGIGYNKVWIDQADIILRFQIDLIASNTDTSEIINAVPNATKVPSKPSKLVFSNPSLSVDYAEINQSVAKLFTQGAMKSRTKYGTFEITVNESRLYPFKQSLVLALNLRSTNTEEWLAKQGWAYLLLQPVVENNGNVLSLRFKDFSGGIEPGLALGLKNTISERLKHLRLRNMDKQYHSIGNLISQSLVKPINGLELEINDPHMAITNVTLSNQAVHADWVYSATGALKVINNTRSDAHSAPGQTAVREVTPDGLENRADIPPSVVEFEIIPDA